MDGNSAFGKDVGLQSYPKAGIAYNISDEPLWKDVLGPVTDIVNSVKVRASYGVTGKFPPAFTRDRTFAANRFQNVGLISFAGFGSKDLKPEKTKTLEFGLDAGFLNDRISIQVSQFEETTEDALFTVGLEPTTGFANKLANVGKIRNRGVEFSIEAIPMSTPDIDWSVRFSFATLTNKVLSLGGSAPFSIGGFAFLAQRIEEGYPIGIFRTNIPRPERGPGQYDANVLDKTKTPTPNLTGSISTSLTLFRDLRISAVGDFAYGHYVLNTGAVIRYFSGLSPEINRVPAGYDFTTASAVWMEKGDFFKLREISARYQIPSWIYEGYSLRGLAVSLSFRNVFTITPSKEFDPELHGLRAGRGLDVGGISFFTLSPPFETRIGVEINL
jgi:outer membrane receptor protein involved in Fe transport